jgi:hypothetical protein
MVSLTQVMPRDTKASYFKGVGQGNINYYEKLENMRLWDVRMRMWTKIMGANLRLEKLELVI